MVPAPYLDHYGADDNGGSMVSYLFFHGKTDAGPEDSGTFDRAHVRSDSSAGNYRDGTKGFQDFSVLYGVDWCGGIPSGDFMLLSVLPYRKRV